MATGTTRPERETLARNVARLRNARGWSQERLGDAAGELRQATISDIETQVANPTLDTLERIASALGCRVRDLFKPARVRASGRGRRPSTPPRPPGLP